MRQNQNSSDQGFFWVWSEFPVDTDYQGSSQIYNAYIVGHLSHFPMSICSMKVLKRTFPFKGIVEGSGHALQTSPIERFTFMIQLKNFSSVQFDQFFCCFCLNKGYVAFMHLFWSVDSDFYFWNFCHDVLSVRQWETFWTLNWERYSIQSLAND